MFRNLEAEQKRYNISDVILAKAIGCTIKTIRNKKNGITEFTLKEILKIMTYFPGMTIEYLFATQVS